ncbi:MAG: plasmid pRiA4b ORF-3 family protein [Candidatus Viridilinea halotolerans]|uniref:Plasmid pRiA4b ORF-3 family protein n=1 Tax=Candidatus Viridilinea halotolerans TaxID=2491704 RepID=A0A426TYC1_9CHLR|nr:MAG: plasmid pRiA4b ORF-3 family protein [Candidatus Viridilinea halotolerans]
MPRKVSTAPHGIYQLKITLKGSKPPIWRRVEVAEDITLDTLHRIIQAAMGWTDSHLHAFTANGISYGVPDMDDFMDTQDESASRLHTIISTPKQHLLYEYDFGDSWEHHVVLEKILAPEVGTHYPRCTAGKRACPPEDCGGIWGYANFLQAIADPEHPEHEEMLDWVGEAFDPEYFDLADANTMLQRWR